LDGLGETTVLSRIFGFLIIRNEIESGHLERFLKWNKDLFDFLLVYDDASDDATAEIIEPFCDVLIRGEFPLFGSEIQNRQILLEKSEYLLSDDDFILWLDADEVIYASKTQLLEICDELLRKDYDGARLPHINLWRSEDFYRIDDSYDNLYPIRLWRWRWGNKLKFIAVQGLHNQLYPEGMRTIASLEMPAVVHYGFASENLLVQKYAMYKAHGQRGKALHRLVSETGLETRPISSRRQQLGNRWPNNPQTQIHAPKQLEQTAWMLKAQLAYKKHEHSREPKVTLISLIYSSDEWLEFEYSELLNIKSAFAEGEIEILFVANNPTPEVRDFLKENLIPYIEHETTKYPDKWLPNHMNRAYNLGVIAARSKYVFLTNSDMSYAPGCLENLLRHSGEHSFLTSRLVEMGRMQTGPHGIEKSFGSNPRNFRRNQFDKYSFRIREDRRESGGLFMPLLVKRADFLSLGGFPEGNLTDDSIENYLATGEVSSYALRGEKCIPGDKALFDRAALLGLNHVTVFNSLAYHFQAGERTDENKASSVKRSGIGIFNDRITGINGETTLWGELSERSQNRGIRTIAFGGPQYGTRFIYWLRSSLVLSRMKIKPRVVISNATFSYPYVGSWRRVVIKQDSPSGNELKNRYLRFFQNVVLRSADVVIANDADFVSASRHKGVDWIVIPISREFNGTRMSLMSPTKTPRCLFVGAFNSVKGWPEIKSNVISRTDIFWEIVSKYEDDNHGLPNAKGPNWRIQRCLSQSSINELMASCDFLIVNSPYESQCLAAIEACQVNLPMLSTPTGLIGNLPEDTRVAFGLFRSSPLSHLDEFLAMLEGGQFAPKEALDDLGICGADGWELWDELIREQLELSFRDISQAGITRRTVNRYFGAFRLIMRQIWREKVLPQAIKLSKTLRIRR